MLPRFQADENLNAKIIAGLRRREPSLDSQTAKAAGILGVADPGVLAVSAQEGRILVSHDRVTLSAHFAHFIVDSTSAGLLIVSPKLDVGTVIEETLLVWTASDAEEWINQIGYLPF